LGLPGPRPNPIVSRGLTNAAASAGVHVTVIAPDSARRQPVRELLFFNLGMEPEPERSRTPQGAGAELKQGPEVEEGSEPNSDPNPNPNRILTQEAK
jgi:hypothetical protein